MFNLFKNSEFVQKVSKKTEEGFSSLSSKVKGLFSKKNDNPVNDS